LGHPGGFTFVWRWAPRQLGIQQLPPPPPPRADNDRVPEKLRFNFYFEGEMGKEHVMNDTKDTTCTITTSKKLRSHAYFILTILQAEFGAINEFITSSLLNPEFIFNRFFFL
jgi:hypothetical protein